MSRTIRHRPQPAGRILLVDDDVGVRVFAARALEYFGFVVETCGTALEALELLGADPGGFDLVLTDHDMPGLTGAELAAAVRVLRRDLPVALWSGRPRGQVRAACPPGVAGVLTKPLSPVALAEAVRRMIG